MLVRKKALHAWRDVRFRRADNDQVFTYLKRDFEETKLNLSRGYLNQAAAHEALDGRADLASFSAGRSAAEMSLFSERSVRLGAQRLTVSESGHARPEKSEKSTQVNARISTEHLQQQMRPII